MLIKEYRIPMPMSVEEYRIAQLYMIQVRSQHHTHHQILTDTHLAEDSQVMQKPRDEKQRIRETIMNTRGFFKNVIAEWFMT